MAKESERPLFRLVSTEIYEILYGQGTGVERGIVVKLLQGLHVQQLVQVPHTLSEPHFVSLVFT